MKKAFLSLLIFISIFMPNSLSAQNTIDKNTLAGSWLGRLKVSGIELRLIFNLKLNDKDSLIATLDSPDQGAKNVPLGRVILKESDLIIQAPALLGEYKGTVVSDTLIEGTWTQKGAAYPINLTKLKTAFVITRPQEPKAPFPYTAEDVTFPNEKFNINLAGTLTIPAGEGPFKAVIMITGSGAQNRDEELMGHKPFLVIADYLSRHGIAVLRYDDRGVGKSQGKYQEATSADLATDGEAAIRFLRNNPKINPKEIGIIGHSEGGLIAPIISASDPGVAFIVSLAGPGVTGERIILKQSEDLGRMAGVKESELKESMEINKTLYAILKKEKDNKTAETKIVKKYTDILEKKKTSKEDIDKSVKQLQATFGADRYTWFRYFIMTDPAVFWKKVKCPVLALNGEKDLQVAAGENLQAIEKTLKSSGNNSIKAIKLPELNHLFQHCMTGLPTEYNTIEETFSPEALKIISDWILAL
jgi:uncharacterized protein